LTCVVLAAAPAAAPVIEMVGPTRLIDASNMPPGSGMLRVYTDTYKVAAGRDGSAVKFPHSGFVILDATGAVRQHVDNHGEGRDDAPSNVPLPAGAYFVKARCAEYGTVTVPIQILEGKLTPVYLSAGGMPPASQPTGRELVRLPNGHVVGVRGTPRR